MDIIDYLLIYNHKEFVITLAILFGQETIDQAARFGFIKVIDQIAYLTIH